MAAAAPSTPVCTPEERPSAAAAAADEAANSLDVLLGTTVKQPVPDGDAVNPVGSSTTSTLVPVTETLQQLGTHALDVLDAAVQTAPDEVGSMLTPVKKFLTWLAAAQASADDELPSVMDGMWAGATYADVVRQHGGAASKPAAASGAAAAAAEAGRLVEGGPAAATPAVDASRPGLKALVAPDPAAAAWAAPDEGTELLGATAAALLEALLAWAAALRGARACTQLVHKSACMLRLFSCTCCITCNCCLLMLRRQVCPAQRRTRSWPAAVSPGGSAGSRQLQKQNPGRDCRHGHTQQQHHSHQCCEHHPGL